MLPSCGRCWPTPQSREHWTVDRQLAPEIRSCRSSHSLRRKARARHSIWPSASTGNGTMGQTNRRASAWPSLAVLLAVLLSAMQPAIADDTPEREQLAALARHLDLIDRLAEHAAPTAPQERDRHPFDSPRLPPARNSVPTATPAHPLP